MEQRLCSGVEAVDTTQLQSEREWLELNYIIVKEKRFIYKEICSLSILRSPRQRWSRNVVRRCSIAESKDSKERRHGYG